jgi:DNA primase
VITEIRERVDLVELVGGYVALKRSGRNFFGLCPFHQEKTGSFSVNPERRIYHCFGCGVTGDAIKFLREHDHLSFPEALHYLAERVGIDLTEYEGNARGGEEFDLLYRAHALATRLFREVLGTPEGRAATEEIGRRGLSAETVAEYRLGAAPEAWDRLLKAATADGIAPEMLQRGGLVIRKEKGGGFYDRFRGRLMFPIEIAGQKVVGFGGRVLGEGEPKYLNSPESPLFQKRRTLYGFPQAQETIRRTREAILVEGYTDVLALSNGGIPGALASLGTAFTAEHAAYLARSCDKVTVLFDGDDAGRTAAQKSAAPLLGAGLEVRVVFLPAGEDPDSTIREEGADRFRLRLEGALSVVDALLGDEAFEGGAGRERAVRRVLESIAPLEDPLRARVYLEELSSRIGLPAELLEEQLGHLRERDVRARRAEPAPASTGNGAPKPAARVTAGELEPLSVIDRTFLGVLVHDETLGETLLERFGEDTFTHPLTRRIVARASQILAQGDSLQIQRLLDSFADDVVAADLIGALCVSGQFAANLERIAKDCTMRLEKRELEREMQDVMQEMRRAKASGDLERMREYGQRKIELKRGIEALLGSSQA